MKKQAAQHDSNAILDETALESNGDNCLPTFAESTSCRLAKLRNLLFSFAFTCFILGPALLFSAQNMLSIPLPSWMTSEDAASLTGNNSTIDFRAFASLDGFISGEFQRAVEEEVADYIPSKASALLMNASLQRNFFRSSNLIFKWDCYPTLFGSDYVYTPRQNTITQIASKEPLITKLRLCAFIAQLKNHAEHNPSIDFVVYIAPSGRDTMDWNPSNSYVSNCWTYQKLKDCIQGNQQPDITNLHLLFWDEPSEKSVNYFFQYDHHWTIQGALLAYRQICNALSMSSISFGETTQLDHVLFSGSQARESLLLLRENVEDVGYDFSNLIIDGNVGAAERHNAFWGAEQNDETMISMNCTMAI